MMNNLKPKGVALTMIFEAESANYGEGIGNVASLKKMARGNGEQYTYISRQAIRYNIIEQLGEPVAEVKAEGSGEKKVIQFSPESSIKDYPEIDLFGYMKTKKGDASATRSAKVRLSNAVSLETFKGDLDFLTNKGLADRLNENMNLAQSEIHKSYYRYSITIDLDQIGIDSNDNVSIDNNEKSRRIEKLLDTVALLYRDIKGRREDLKPLFIIGGVYNTKNPIFQNVVEVKNNKIDIEAINGVMFDSIKQDTICAVVKGKFSNCNEIYEKLEAMNMPEFFTKIKEGVKKYYASC